MTTYQFILFVLALALPSAYQRTKFALKRSAFMITPLRTKSGLQIHHAHWGLMFLFASSIALAFGYHGWLAVIGLGYGWGLILDEIMPHLKMPSVGREIELDVYAASLRGTIILIAAVIIIMVVVFAIAGPHYDYRLPSGYIS